MIPHFYRSESRIGIRVCKEFAKIMSRSVVAIVEQSFGVVVGVDAASQR